MHVTGTTAPDGKNKRNFVDVSIKSLFPNKTMQSPTGLLHHNGGQKAGHGTGEHAGVELRCFFLNLLLSWVDTSCH